MAVMNRPLAGVVLLVVTVVAVTVVPMINGRRIAEPPRRWTGTLNTGLSTTHTP